MAKFPYTKLNAKINQEVVAIAVEGTEANIEVRQYLPIDEKLNLIGKIMELSHDVNNFANPLKIKVYYTLEMIFTYTNIAFTEKQKESLTKLYDSLVSSGWVDTIFNIIPANEQEVVWTGLMDTVNAFYGYRNSVYGVMEVLGQDYSDLQFDINSLTENLQNGKNIEFLKDVMNKLG